MTTDTYGGGLFPQHAEMLAASGISPERARARRYRSVDTKVNLEHYGVTAAGRKVPGLLVPMLRVDGSEWGYQYRPDSPRERGGKPVKYETPVGQRNGIDFPPGVRDKLADLTTPLWITEGVKKADSAVQRGLACIALPGVWSWKGKPGNGPHESTVALADWDDVGLKGRGVVLAFDSDVMVKPAVRKALDRLAAFLVARGVAEVRYLVLPDVGDGKTGLDDFLATRDVDELGQHVRKELPPPEREPATAAPEPARAVPGVESVTLPPPVTLDECHGVFRKWMGPGYDLGALDVILAAAAIERLDGDPLWALIVAGSGNAKTETVQSARTAGALTVSTIASEGALLSGTSSRERAADATGGMLRQLEPRGLLVIKDVTSILSMSRDARQSVLGALREIYDGYWDREVGTDGGRRLEWAGRIGVLGAVTTAWDQAHAVIASLGDRFVLVRTDSRHDRAVSARQALANTGSERQMREELGKAFGGVIAGMGKPPADLTEDEIGRLVGAADLVTLARTAVEFDRGEVDMAHDAEAPTRFARQLQQVFRGAVAIGADRDDALRLALRVARDSMPPLRLAILDDLAAHPGSTSRDVHRRIGAPRSTARRQVDALHMLRVIEMTDEEEMFGKTVWRFSLAADIDPAVVELADTMHDGCRQSWSIYGRAPLYVDSDDTDTSLGARGIQPKMDQPVPQNDAVPEPVASHPWAADFGAFLAAGGDA